MRDVSRDVAVSALPVTLPVRFAVIVPAEKPPVELRRTTVFGVASGVADPPIRPIM